MSINNKLTAGIAYNCESDQKSKAKLDGTAVLINVDDVDVINSRFVNGVITELVLKAGKTGYGLSWYKDLAGISGTYAPSTDDVDGFKHLFDCRAEGTSAENMVRATELKNGRFIIAYETRFKGVDGFERYKVGGWQCGMRATEIANNSREKSGAITFILGTEELDYEEFIYNIVFYSGSVGTEYAATETAFTTLFANI